MEEDIINKICEKQDFNKILLKLKELDRNKKFRNMFQNIEKNNEIPLEMKRQIDKEIYDYIDEINKNLKEKIKEIFILGIKSTLKEISEENSAKINLDYKKWWDRYHHEKIIEFKKEFSSSDVEIFEKLGISLEDKLYTRYEIEVLWLKFLKYYEDNDLTEDEKLLIKPLYETDVTQEEYNTLAKKLENIIYEKNLLK